MSRSTKVRVVLVAGVSVLALVAAACAAVATTPALERTTTTTPDRITVTTTTATTTTTVPEQTTTTAAAPRPTSTTTTRGQIPPTVSIECPEDFEFETGATAKVTFGYTYSLGSSNDAIFDIDYGDGNSWNSPNAAHAERNAFWHDYEAPGTFTATVRVQGSNGMQASGSCTFGFGWIAPPAAAVTPPSFGSPGLGIPAPGFDAAACTYDGIPLWGRVQIVDYFADVSVQVVDYLPDVRVQVVDYLPTNCGKWQLVDYLPDFTVQIVDYLADVDIQVVGYLPGT